MHTPRTKRYNKREKQALAMARALAPGLVPALASLHALARAEAYEERSLVHRHIWELFRAEQAAGRLPGAPAAGSDDAAWLPARGASVIVLAAIEIALEYHTCTQRDPEDLWRRAHFGTPKDQAGGGDHEFPPPLTLAEVRAMLAFDGAALAYLTSSPAAVVRSWAVQHLHLVEGGPRFEGMHAKMQHPEVQAATERALNPDPREMGAAAEPAATRKRKK